MTRSESLFSRALAPAILVALMALAAACSGAATATTAPPAATATPGSAATAVPQEPTPTPEPDAFVLNIASPVEEETITGEASVTVAGQTRVDAVVSINDTFVEPDADGRFSLVVPLEVGPNVIEVVASISDTETLSSVLTVISIPGA